MPNSEHDKPVIEHDQFKPYKPVSEQDKIVFDHHHYTNDHEVDRAEQQDMPGPKQRKIDPEPIISDQKKPDPEQDEPSTEHDHLKSYKPGFKQDQVNSDHDEHRTAPEMQGLEQYTQEPNQNTSGQNIPNPEHDPEPDQNMSGQNILDPKQDEPGIERDHLKPFKPVPGKMQKKVDLDHDEHRSEVNKPQQQGMPGPDPKSERSTASHDKLCQELGMPVLKHGK